MAFLERALDLFEQYFVAVDERGAIDRDLRDLLGEVWERLEQLDYIVDSTFGRLDQYFEQYFPSQPKEPIARLANSATNASGSVSGEDESAAEPLGMTEDERWKWRLNTEIILFTEMFYHTAWRLRTILRNTVSPLPHLSGFEATGVRDVRNKLIEHPEGADSRVFSQSRALSRKGGVEIKAGRYSDQLHVFRDRGFAANVEEFRLELEKSLTNALKAFAV